MKPFVHVTGPHPARIRMKDRRAFVWHVRIEDADHEAAGRLYRVMSYRRAVSLSCNMAHDRRLFLRLDALPY